MPAVCPMLCRGDQRLVPSHQAAAGVLRTLAAACQLIEQLAQAVQRASLQLLAQLAHSFFMPLCLTAVATLARIQVCSMAAAAASMLPPCLPALLTSLSC